MGVAACVLGTAGADTIETKDGKVLSGRILFHNGTQYYIDVGNKVEKVNISEVTKITFDPEAPDRNASETSEAALPD